MTVVFEHRTDRLSGELVHPVGPPRAALVFLHGSGPAEASVWAQWAAAFAEHGIASLRYDKPGVGASHGDWTTQTFDDRAAEALAAVRCLRSRLELPGIRVGVLGMSQGAWIGPHAASLAPEVEFVVALSGSADGPREQDRFRVAHELGRDGFDAAEIAEALEVWDASDELFRSDADDATLAGSVARYSDRRWFPYFVFADPRLIPYGRLIWDYDPLPFLERCRCPLLAVWGSADALVDADASPRVFARTLQASGSPRSRLVTIHGADHGLRVDGERPPELFDWISAWVLRAGAT